MRKLPFITLFVLFLLSTVSAQMEYGKAADLKGLTKVFIDTGADMEVRERIVKQIEKAKLGVEILGSDEDAEIMMLFRDQESDTVTGVSSNSTDTSWGRTTNSTVIKVPLIAGAGQVFVKGSNNKPRLVLSVQNSQQSRLEKRPSTKFADAFIKAYREANGLTKQ